MEEPRAKRRCVKKSQHDIFLSHSGEEKAFVEQLDHDLRMVNQRPFFDQNSDCLQKAEKFAPEILEAAEQCRVGVVVVSEGYLTSKWPMLELSRFMECGVPVFPLFFKLSPSELKNKEVESKWKQRWQRLVERGEVGEEVLDLWSKAVKELRSSNGLMYEKFAKSEYKYRGAVVEEICKRWPPILEWSMDGIHGYERLCEATLSMFMETKVGGKDGRVEKCLGIYGMGGLGKTTLCKSMCGYFVGKFGGRVLHLELPSENAHGERAGEERFVRLKRVLQQLARVDKLVIDSISSEEQGWACLRDRLRIMRPIFLAIDNIGDFASSREEAQRYMKIGLPSGSKVLVTARSRGILINVLGKAECCKPIPRLEWEEAATLFLSCAAPNLSPLSCLKAEEREIVEKCLSQCLFKDSGYELRQHHPLVLRALGSYFHDEWGDDVMSWGEALESWKGTRVCGAERVNDILGLNYGSLSDGEKLVFLDFVLCYPQHIRNFHGWWFEEKGNDFQVWVSWISEAHKVSIFEAKRMVKKLQRLSMVEDSDVEVSIHDLYKEFARALVEKEGSKEWLWWMSGSSDQMRLKRLVLSCDKSIIGVAPRRFLEWRSMVVLELNNCNDVGPELELGSFCSLRTLRVSWCWNVKRILCSCNKGYNDKVCCYKRKLGGGCMSELRSVHLDGLRSLEGIPFMRHCGNLRHYYIAYCYRSLPDLECDVHVDFRFLQALESFWAIESFQAVVYNVGAFMRWLLCALQLRNLVVFAYECRHIKLEGEGGYTLDLNEVVGLSPRLSLLILMLPRQIKEVKGLHLLSELTLLDLSYSQGLSHLPDLQCLPKLKWLCVRKCCRLECHPSVGLGVQGICERSGQDVFDWHSQHECLQPYDGVLCKPERMEPFKLELVREPYDGVLCKPERMEPFKLELVREDDSEGIELEDGRRIPEELNLAIW